MYDYYLIDDAEEEASSSIVQFNIIAHLDDLSLILRY